MRFTLGMLDCKVPRMSKSCRWRWSSHELSCLRTPTSVELLARDRLGLPSVILLRRNHDPADQVRTILAALADVADDLLAGAIVVIVEDRLRIRRLPIRYGDRAVRAATALARSSSQVAVADRPPWGHRGLGSERSRIAAPAGSRNSVKTRPWEHSLRMTVILSRSAGSHG